MFNFHSKILVFACLLGVVDQVHGLSVSVEINSADGNVQNLDIPTLLFPCEVREGDFFYMNNVDGVMEIRCGEPPNDG